MCKYDISLFSALIEIAQRVTYIPNVLPCDDSPPLADVMMSGAILLSPSDQTHGIIELQHLACLPHTLSLNHLPSQIRM